MLLTRFDWSNSLYMWMFGCSLTQREREEDSISEQSEIPLHKLKCYQPFAVKTLPQ